MNKAILTIRNIPKMHHMTRKSIAAWLRKKADELESADPKEFAENYQAKFN